MIYNISWCVTFVGTYGFTDSYSCSERGRRMKIMHVLWFVKYVYSMYFCVKRVYARQVVIRFPVASEVGNVRLKVGNSASAETDLTYPTSSALAPVHNNCSPIVCRHAFSRVTSVSVPLLLRLCKENGQFYKQIVLALHIATIRFQPFITKY